VGFGKKFALAAGAAVVAFGIAAPASAVGWGTLTATYNSQARATGYGNFYNGSNIKAINDYRLNDVANDGNNSYGKTNFLFYGYHSSCGGDCWYSKKIQSTGEYTYFNTPVTKALYSYLEPQATTARGDSYVCVQLGWPVPDKCSSHAYPSFNY
jgi:hypothetical protein